MNENSVECSLELKKNLWVREADIMDMFNKDTGATSLL